MINIETYIKNGWPALVVLAACVVVLLLLRFAAPVLIARFQRKKPLTKDDV